MNRLSGLVLLNTLVCGAATAAAQPARQESQPQARVITVQDAIRLTLQHAPEVSLAVAQATRASETVRETRSLNLPQITTGTGLAYNNGFPLSIEGAAPSIFEIGLSQPIFSKKNKNLILEAEQSSKAIQLGPEAARHELAAKTALVYYDLLQAHKLKNLWTDRLQAAVTDQQITENLLEAGKVRPLDVTLAQTATANARQQVLVSDEQVKLTEAQLRDLTGIPESTPIQTAEPQIDGQLADQSEDTIYARALETNPDVLQAEANLQAKEFHVEAEKGDGLPRFDIISQYSLFSKTNNYQDFFKTFTRNNFIIGLSVQLPLFNGHRTSARVAQSQQEAAEARFRLQRLKSDLKLGIGRALSALRIARGAVDLAGREVATAREVLQVNETLLQGGRISGRELELARSQMREKEIAQLESQRALFQREIELLKVSGTISSLF
ncbi:MAG TPA: TolC family protein [Acidobacteriota bacterium]|nr:TolC family protein [Acidobacteriota bacterium]